MSVSGMDDIRQIFETECYEGLDVIEAGLLALEGGDNNLETVNNIFRGAHSIKGGAATFGYTNISEFTHEMETLLDQMRSEELEVSPPLVKLFLDSVDCLRTMVENMDGGSYDEERVAEVHAELVAWLKKGPAGEDEEEAPVLADEADDAIPGAKKWHIHFVPQQAFLMTGNQPQHIFRALAEYGKMTLTPDYSKLPLFGANKPEEMYLSWDIELEADLTKEQILAEFDWVESECSVEVTEGENEAVPALEGELIADKKVQAAKSVQRKKEPRKTKKDPGSIRVDIDKIDVLLNLVGEMVINQSILNQQNIKINEEENGNPELTQSLALLERTTRELQEAVMQIRMLPVSSTFNRFPRLVYDLSSKLNKKVELKITGEGTELDKTVLEKIGDPLLHLIRNSLDHGIEMPEKRLEVGKEETGTIHLHAAHEGGSVVIRVSDDGAGLNTKKIHDKAIDVGLVKAEDNLSEQQINDLIFHAGFSTADEITDVSGRGVGMDVVRSNIEDIGGRVEVRSEPGKGSTFQITLPLTLAILDGQLIKVAGEVYVIPLLAIVETVQVNMERINVISGKKVVYRLRGEAIPVIDMRTVCRIPGKGTLESFEKKQLVIVESDRKSVGLIVDELLDQYQVVIKSLETNFVKVPGMLGATILGNGTVSLILDVSTLTESIQNDNSSPVEH